jgi:hypothetical protein
MNGGVTDAFAAQLSPAGSALSYSTYLGGGDTDEGFAIAVDCAGNTYITGVATSTDFPTTTGARQTVHGGTSSNEDAFVAKISDSASSPQPPCTAAGGHTVGGHGGTGGNGGNGPTVVGKGGSGGVAGLCGGGGAGGGGIAAGGGGAGGGGCFRVDPVQRLSSGRLLAIAGAAEDGTTVRADAFAALGGSARPRSSRSRANRPQLIGSSLMRSLRRGRHTVVVRLSKKARRAFKRARRVTVLLSLRMTAPTGRPLLLTHRITLRR